MTQDQTTPTSMFCRKCGYQLVGLSENRCPECGQPFDPANRRTYLRHPRGWLLQRRLRRAVFTLLSVLILVGAGTGWLYWGWRAEQPIIAAIRSPARPQNSVTVAVGPAAMPWLAHLAGVPDDSTGVPLPYVSTRRTGLCWAWEHLAATGLMDRVVEVDLINSPLEYYIPLLEQLRHVRILYLVGGSVTDAHLRSIDRIRSLKFLNLNATNITDPGLVHLYGLKNLLELHVTGAKVTAEGIQKLKQALPNVKVTGPEWRKGP